MDSNHKRRPGWIAPHTKVYRVLAPIMLTLIAPTAAYATNGLNRIGFGTESVGMGGADIAVARDDLSIQFRVARITPESQTQAGDVTYKVLIDIVRGDTSRLRWGMTTFVDIEVGPGV